MSRWLIAVHGEPFDLEELPRWFPDGEVFAFSEGSSFFLTGSRFDFLINPVDVLDVATDALSERCAIVSLLWPGMKQLSVGAVFREQDDGQRIPNTMVRAEVGALRIKAGRPSAFQAGTGGGQTDAQRLLVASRSNRHLEIALLLWASADKSWPRLYRLAEELEAYIGMPVDKVGFCSDPERVRFTHSANSSAAGIDSRHREGRYAPPRTPMAHDEAVAFVRQLIIETLKRANAEAANP